MPSLSALTALASLAFSSVSVARPIPHSISMFRRAVHDANDGLLVIQNKDTPKKYGHNLEPYDQYHFRYMAIGCPDVEHDVAFFQECCRPRGANKQEDKDYPTACRLDSYLVFDPVYSKDKVVAKLGSLIDYKDKMHYDSDGEKGTEQVESNSAVSDNAGNDSASASTANETAFTPSSSPAAPVFTPASSSSWSEPSSSSSSWVASSSSSSSWTPEAAPSSSSWAEPSSSSSSEWQAPAPSSSSSEWVAPDVHVAQAATTPWSSSQWIAPSSSSPAYVAPALTSSANTNTDVETFTGTASWYTQNGNAGACGQYHSDSDYIVALKTDLYGWTGQRSQYCGRSLTITNTATGATAQAIAADACPGCSSYYSLDLSTGLFQALGNLDQGLLPISWHWN